MKLYYFSFEGGCYMADACIIANSEEEAEKFLKSQEFANVPQPLERVTLTFKCDVPKKAMVVTFHDGDV